MNKQLEKLTKQARVLNQKTAGIVNKMSFDERQVAMNNMSKQLKEMTKQLREKNKEMTEVVAKMDFDELIEREKTTTNPIFYILLNDEPYLDLLYKASNSTNTSEISIVRAKMAKIIIERMEEIIERYIMPKINITFE